MAKPSTAPEADICLLLEGTYPYILGGVSSWVHELIEMQKPLTFSIVTILGKHTPPVAHYTLPSNVVSLTPLPQTLRKGRAALPRPVAEKLFENLETPLMRLQSNGSMRDLAAILEVLEPHRDTLGSAVLLDSKPAWEMLVRMYETSMPDSAFIDYFWSWRALFGNLYSVLLAGLPRAKLYHALCTGYAGVFLARARLETGRPCLVTEHGIYTNERRIEIASAEWLEDHKDFSLEPQAPGSPRELKDFWTDMFCTYSRLCYEASSRIITLYEGNQPFQKMDGAAPEKLHIIPNGIDCERFSGMRREHGGKLRVGFIGRVVPIKGVKTFIQACAILRQTLPQAEAYIIGPTDEDPLYYDECLHIAAQSGAVDMLTFTGKVNIDAYLPKIDLLVLTSISEAQPLAILEAGAAGIPVVATNVGACSEMVLGRRDENPYLGPGGIVTPLASPQATANAMLMLLSNPSLRSQYGQNLQRRVRAYYDKKDQKQAYAELYGSLAHFPLPHSEAA